MANNLPLVICGWLTTTCSACSCDTAGDDAVGPACAASFVAEHVHPRFGGEWLMVDLTAPAVEDERATGFGVALALGILGAKGFS